MNANADRLVISEGQRQEMLAHIIDCLPEEACGLLGGRLLPGAVMIDVVLPVENELHSPVRFRMAPKEQLNAFYQLEEQGLELVAIFHSHPAGPNHPSLTDLEEFAYPGVFYVIWSTNAGAWQMNAFKIEDQVAVEIQVT